MSSSTSVSKVKEQIRCLESRFTDAPGSLPGRKPLGPPLETTFESSRSGSECSTASNLPEGTVRSRRNKGSIPVSLAVVQSAVAEHLNDLEISNASNSVRSTGMLGNTQLTSTTFQHSNMSNRSQPSTPLRRNTTAASVAAAPHSPASTSHSNQTLVTSHVKKTTPMVSPNMPRKGGLAASSPGGGDRAALSRQSSAVRSINFDKVGSHPPPSSSKRKSFIPIKKETAPKSRRVKASAVAVSPSKKRSRQQTIVDEVSSHSIVETHTDSNDRSNPPAASDAKRHKPLTKITRFFKHTSMATSTSQNSPMKPDNSIDATPKHAAKPESPTKATPTIATEEDGVWKERYQLAMKEIQEKNEQLKAVSNTRNLQTIALDSELKAMKSKLGQLEKEMASKTSKTGMALEELMRWKSKQNADALREKLAMNSPRLGRWGYTHTIARVKETWEEGSATKDLHLRKEKLKEERKCLLQRKEKLLAIQDASNKDSESVSSGHTTDEDSLVPGLTKLEFAEESEAIEVNLLNLMREEEKLMVEVEALRDEQANHIRSLRRVSHEDSSAFRSRPKLNDRYVLDCILGKGGFSEVWKAYDLVDLREVAVKIHQLDPRWHSGKRESYTKHVSREYAIQHKARHPRIVSLLDVFEIDENSFATVLECCSGTDLDILLKEKKVLPERQARKILLQIMSGMQYLSQLVVDNTTRGVIHYDLKPGNILFDEHGDAKITDFGLSKMVESDQSSESMELTSKGAGTYWYLPPECFLMDDDVRISNKVDVWSIGIIFYQMLYGRRPFGEGKSQEELATNGIILNAHQVSFPEHPTVSPEGKAFIQSCLTYDQAYRPNIAQLCESGYLLRSPFPSTSVASMTQNH